MKHGSPHDKKDDIAGEKQLSQRPILFLFHPSALIFSPSRVTDEASIIHS